MNTDEETGSVQSRPMIEAAARTASVALIFEPARPDGSVVTGRRGVQRYRIRVEGKAAHSGVEPWVGINAIEGAAHKVLALQALNGDPEKVSVTVAMVRGGLGMNVVPALAELDVDTRFVDNDHGLSTQEAVAAIALREDVPGAVGSLEVLGSRPALTPHRRLAGITRRYTSAAKGLGIVFRAVATGGASDGCFTSALGVPTIDGLGPVGGAYHTDEEFIQADSLVERAVLTAAVLTTLRSARAATRANEKRAPDWRALP
jgi:glutamate carboxypeptidase